MIKSFSVKPRMIRTVAQMLIDRGYDLTACIRGDELFEADKGVSLSLEDVDDLLKYFSLALTPGSIRPVLQGQVPADTDRVSFVRHLDPGEKVGVYMLGGAAKLGKSAIISILDEAIEHGVARVILPLMIGYTVHVPKEIARVRASHGVITEMFVSTELYRGVGNHEMAPVYQVLQEEEIDRLLKEHSLDQRYQLPQMQESDPQARYFGLTNGMVVKENRPTLYYRVIIPPV
jgi:DNA-directed RNA polymerase I, II, and III subunit RPABC1